MSAFLNQQLTDVGWDALSTALGGGRLTFFKMQAGDGNIAGDGLIPGMTALVHPVCDIGLTKYEIDGKGQIVLFGNIASSQLDVGFTFRELGVFCTIEPPGALGGSAPGTLTQSITAVVAPSAPPVAGQQANVVVPNPPVGTALMYSYCNAYANSDYIPGKTESTTVVNTVQVTVKIDKAASVVINITAGQQMSVANIGPATVGAGVWDHTQANVAYLKRLVGGTGTQIVEDANTITIGQKALQTDTYLYVANGNPDVTPNFSTLQKAWDYLTQYAIPSNITAVINIAAGLYNTANTTTLWHNNGDRIIIQGSTSSSVNFTGATVTGSQNNWTVKLTGVASMASITVGSYVLIWNANWLANGSGANMLITGCYKVTAVTSNTLTFIARYRGTTWPNMTGFTGGSLYPVTAVISPPRNVGGLYIGSRGLAQLSDVVVVPQAPSTLWNWGILCIGPSTFSRVGVTGFDAGASGQLNHSFYVSGNGANVALDYCCASANNCGFVSAAGANIYIGHAAATHNSGHGFWLEAGNASGSGGLAFAAGNGGIDFLVSDGSTLGVQADYTLGPYTIECGYSTYGMYVNNGSRAIINNNSAGGGVSQLIAIAHDYFDVGAVYLSSFLTASTVWGSRVFNIPLNALSSNGGYIG